MGHTALVFEARVRDRLVQGVSLPEDDEHDRIKTITLMIRPLRDSPRAVTPCAHARATSRWFHHPASGGPRHNANAGRGRSIAAPWLTGRPIRPQPW